jgi:putative transposase
MDWRRSERRPWHSPPHRPSFGRSRYLLTASCYEHRPHIGRDGRRLDDFVAGLLRTLAGHARRTFAWCVLPNHYHALVDTADVETLLDELGRFHGRTSHLWNGEEGARGRIVFFGCVERAIRSERHFWATVNYVHHNPVRHGYVARWTDWRWSSACEYLEQTGLVRAERIWRKYPVRDYGKDWDAPEL